jgi:hypothetical protein
MKSNVEGQVVCTLVNCCARDLSEKYELIDSVGLTSLGCTIQSSDGTGTNSLLSSDASNIEGI